MNIVVNSTNSQSYVIIDSLRSAPTDFSRKIYKKILNATTVKKYFFTFKFNTWTAPELFNPIYYPPTVVAANNRTVFRIAQFNNISNMMPPIPVLYDWDKIPQVSLQPIL